jgi:transposase
VSALATVGREHIQSFVIGHASGVSDLTASVLVAEIGVDMTRFPSAGHLVSWAGLCPRSDESAGKRRSTRVRKSGTWIKTPW